MANSKIPVSVRPRIASMQLTNYRAFESLNEPLELARITIILGRNNAGKSALCFAPVYFAQAFRPDAKVPLITGESPYDFDTPSEVIFCGAPSGTGVTFGLQDAGGVREVEFEVTLEAGGNQLPTRFRILEDDGPGVDWRLKDRPTWARIQREFKRRPGLVDLASEVGGLRGLRPLPPPDHDYLGYLPESVGPNGEYAAETILRSGDEGLQQVNQWYRQLNAQLSIEQRDAGFSILARGATQHQVNLTQSGAGLAQLLPLIVQLTLSSHTPRLFCIEQPELHMHPGAHALVAQALIDRALDDPEQRFLIETHSDAFVLRVRRSIAEGKLAPDDVRIYFVDETTERLGSAVRRIRLDDEASPDWWPRGVFAEPETEYFALKRALSKRAKVRG